MLGCFDFQDTKMFQTYQWWLTVNETRKFITIPNTVKSRVFMGSNFSCSRRNWHVCYISRSWRVVILYGSSFYPVRKKNLSSWTCLSHENNKYSTLSKISNFTFSHLLRTFDIVILFQKWVIWWCMWKDRGDETRSIERNGWSQGKERWWD